MVRLIAISNMLELEALRELLFEKGLILRKSLLLSLKSSIGR